LEPRLSRSFEAAQNELTVFFLVDRGPHHRDASGHRTESLDAVDTEKANRAVWNCPIQVGKEQTMNRSASAWLSKKKGIVAGVGVPILVIAWWLFSAREIVDQ
jgi:hypothetical protein